MSQTTDEYIPSTQSKIIPDKVLQLTTQNELTLCRSCYDHLHLGHGGKQQQVCQTERSPGADHTENGVFETEVQA